MISPLLSARLHCLRWVAALLVLVSHLKPLLFAEHADLKQKGVLVDCFYLVTGLGHEAVIVFFVMSGLLVGGLSVERHRQGRFVPTQFILQRFSRIYIVLIPALLVGFLWDQFGLSHFAASGLYTESPKFRMDGIAANQLSWRLMMENGLMMQHIAVPILGSNGALWSISYEWWCYALFLFGFTFMASCRQRTPRFRFALLGCLTILLLPLDVMRYFVIWLVGVAVLFSPLRRVRCNRLLAYAIVLATILWSRMHHENGTVGLGLGRPAVCDMLLAGACFFLFTALNQARESTGHPRPVDCLHQRLADFSYTTYLVHLPFMLLIVAVLNRFFDMPVMQQPSLAGIGCFTGIVLVVYFYAWCFAQVTERHTERLRHWLHGRLALVQSVR